MFSYKISSFRATPLLASPHLFNRPHSFQLLLSHHTHLFHEFLVHVYYQTKASQDLSNGQIMSIGLQVIRSHLQSIKTSGLAGLLREMLSEDPKNRPITGEVLLYPCFSDTRLPTGSTSTLPAVRVPMPIEFCSAGDMLHT